MEISTENQVLLEKHLKLVIEANRTTNITRIDSFEEGKLLHVEDSLAAFQEVNAAPAGLYADLGSGAGYPGIPLAILTGRTTLLVDSVGKKTSILKTMIERLNLAATVTTYTGRIEDLAREQPQAFSVLTARALARLSVIMELASPLLIRGGRLVCYKAKRDEAEYHLACSLKEKLGMALIEEKNFLLSDGETARTIYTFEKVAMPQIDLPRRTGMAQKKPLQP